MAEGRHGGDCGGGGGGAGCPATADLFVVVVLVDYQFAVDGVLAARPGCGVAPDASAVLVFEDGTGIEAVQREVMVDELVELQSFCSLDQIRVAGHGNGHVPYVDEPQKEIDVFCGKRGI